MESATFACATFQPLNIRKYHSKYLSNDLLKCILEYHSKYVLNCMSKFLSNHTLIVKFTVQAQGYVITYVMTYAITHVITYEIKYVITYAITYVITYVISYAITYVITNVIPYINPNSNPISSAKPHPQPPYQASAWSYRYTCSTSQYRLLVLADDLPDYLKFSHKDVCIICDICIRILKSLEW